MPFCRMACAISGSTSSKDAARRAGGAPLPFARRIGVGCRRDREAAADDPLSRAAVSGRPVSAEAAPQALARFCCGRAMRCVGGASDRDIANCWSAERTQAGWNGRSGSLRSRVRRLVGEASGLTEGGDRWLMGGGAPGEGQPPGQAG